MNTLAIYAVAVSNRLFVWAFFVLFTSLLSASQTSALIGQPYQISGPQITSGNVSNKYNIGPNGKYVVYIADQESDGHFELFSVPINGGATVKLSNYLDYNVLDFEISQDGQYVVCRTKYSSDGFNRLFSVPITGGQNIMIAKVPFSNSLVNNYQISENSQRVVFHANEIGADTSSLYSNSIRNFGLATKISSNNAVELDFHISSDSKRVVYRQEGGAVANGRIGLLGVDIDGGAMTTFSNTSNGQDVVRAQISNNGQVVVYLRTIHGSLGPVTDIFRTPITANQSAQVSKFFENLRQNEITDFSISQNGKWVVYIGDSETAGKKELFAVNISSASPGSVIKLNGGLAEGGEVSKFKISDDSQHVFYIADQNIADRDELFTVEISGGPTKRLNSPIPSAFNHSLFGRFEISADGKWVVYQIKNGNSENSSFTLWQSKVGGVAMEVNYLLLDAVPDSFEISEDSKRVLARGEAPSNGEINLYSRELNSAEEAVIVNSSLPTPVSGSTLLSGIGSFDISSDGQHVVYWGDQDEQLEYELFARRLKEAEDELCFPIKASNGNMVIICL
jgi:dipeptidyl aminopeptidase/acylaminoacyl peptidase